MPRISNPKRRITSKADYTGKLLPLMKQPDRAINWKKHKTDEILRRINAADGSPGVLDEIYGKPVFMFNAHKEAHLTGKAGEIIATANHAICRATVDGAIWIGHLKPKLESGEKGIKLPATFVLKDLLPKASSGASTLKSLLSKTIKLLKSTIQNRDGSFLARRFGMNRKVMSRISTLIFIMAV